MLIDERLVKDLFPKRNPLAHKGSYQKVLAIGGSKSMHGAIELVSEAAYRSGVGTLTLLIPEAIYLPLAINTNYAMKMCGPSDEDGFLSYKDFSKAYKNYDIITIGNGMGRKEATKAYLRDVLKTQKKIIIDADGLYYLKDMLDDIKSEVIITPHLKEMSYVTGLSLEEIMDDPYGVAKDFCTKYTSITLILKSAKTIIQKGETSYTLDRPTSSLAKGGSGDILCGLVAGFWAQGLEALDTSIVATYVHNAAGHINKDPLYVLPKELLGALDEVYKSLR